jgi:hypothetical protein
MLVTDELVIIRENMKLCLNLKMRDEYLLQELETMVQIMIIILFTLAVMI